MSDAVNLIRALGGEAMVYTPHGGTPTTVQALVERRPLEIDGGGRAFNYARLEIQIAHDATDGVTTVKAGQDTVTFKLNVDDVDPTEFRVVKILNQDLGITAGANDGMWHLEVQG